MTTAALLYAAGTLAGWLGWFFVVRTVVLGAGFATAPAGERPSRVRPLVVSAVLAVLGLAGAAAVPVQAKEAALYRLPVVWFAMPFVAWLTVVAVAMAATRVVQASLAGPGEPRADRLKAAGIWLVVAVLGVWLYRRDPANAIAVIKGSVPFDARGLALTLVPLLGGAAVLAVAARHTASRTAGKTVLAHLALLAGSVIFGLPFAFLVITSFKEDRDMASPNGIVWVPKVSLTRPYLDPKNPLYEVPFGGETVQATILDQKPDGTVRMDVFKPLSVRGTTFEARREQMKEIPRDAPLVTAKVDGRDVPGMVVEELDSGERRVRFDPGTPLAGQEKNFAPTEVEPIRENGLRWQNYPDALGYLPPETANGLVYLKNTLLLVVMGVVGTVMSSSIVAYAFSRLQWPGRDAWFSVLLATMMLPGAVTLLPQFLIFRSLGWIDTLYPLWVPAFFSSAFNVFLLRQFFKQIPMELEDASKIDGASYLRTFWDVMLPQIKPALVVIAIWTFLGAWNNFQGPLIYVNSPQNMPLSYALQLFQGDRGGEPGLLMAFATLCMLPVLVVYFFAQRYFIEGVTLSGLGGR